MKEQWVLNKVNAMIIWAAQCASPQSDQGLKCPLTESLDTTEYIMDSKCSDDTVEPRYLEFQGTH